MRLSFVTNAAIIVATGDCCSGWLHWVAQERNIDLSQRDHSRVNAQHIPLGGTGEQRCATPAAKRGRPTHGQRSGVQDCCISQPRSAITPSDRFQQFPCFVHALLQVLGS